MKQGYWALVQKSEEPHKHKLVEIPLDVGAGMLYYWHPAEGAVYRNLGDDWECLEVRKRS